MKLSRIAALVLTAGMSSQALAMELGELSVTSAIDQPFSAKLEVVGPEKLDPSKIRIGLSARQAFEPKGQALSVKVDRIVNENGHRYLLLSSSQPVKAPFVSLQVEIAGLPEGRISNDYDLLLDKTSSSDIPALPQDAKSQVASNDTAGKTTKSSGSDGNFYGPISPSDTLWSIASNLRPDNSVSVYQTMIAIERKNPGAFVGGDINRLVKGSILKVPTLAEVQQVDPADARRRFVSGTVTASELGADVAGQSQPPVTQTKAKPVPAKAKASTDKALQEQLNQQNQQHAEEMAQLRKELASSTNNLEKVLTENQQLKSRLAQINDELTSLRQQLADEVKLQGELRKVIAKQNKDLAEQQAKEQEASQGFFSQLLNSTWGLALLIAIPGLILLLLAFRWWRNRDSEPEAPEQSLASRVVGKEPPPPSDDDGMEMAAAAVAAEALHDDNEADNEPTDEIDIPDDPLSDASLDEAMASLPEDDAQKAYGDESEDDFAVRLDDEGDLDDWLAQEQESSQQQMDEAEAMLEEESDDFDSALSEAEALLGASIDDEEEHSDATSDDTLAFEGADEDDTDALLNEADELLTGEPEVADEDDTDALLNEADEQLAGEPEAAEEDDTDALLNEADELLAGEPEAADEDDTDALLNEADELLAGEPEAADEDDTDALLSEVDDLLASEPEAADEDDTDALLGEADELLASEPEAVDEDDTDALLSEADELLASEPEAADEDDTDALLSGVDTDDELDLSDFDTAGVDLDDDDALLSAKTDEAATTADEADDQWDDKNTLSWEAPAVDTDTDSNSVVEASHQDDSELPTGLDWEGADDKANKPKADNSDEFIEIDELIKAADDDLSDEDPYGEWSLDLDELGDLGGTGDADESSMASKLDLARAYMEIDDADSARELLSEVQSKGSEDEKAEALKLLNKLDS
ncbi:FimV/HubP family polar landmark protein [Gallaecimonas sp. GXIMD1310]|uniref:FimV/HubP family polar landmark protein n=1 Tax=Gallaecimonas sp. GXIMD1310 TaxID=3131926 RepID=UPI00324545A9